MTSVLPSDVSQRPKVFGIGWAKTGTTTLAACFRILGYAHQSQNLALVPQIMRGDLRETMRIAASKASFEDWPWPLLYRDLDRAFPGSKFILTTRDPERWLDSYRAMLTAQGPPDERLKAIRSFIYGMDVESAPEEKLLQRFCRHNSDVLAYFSRRPGDLLVVDWERGDAWEEICAFLGAAVPDCLFPHLNRRA